MEKRIGVIGCFNDVSVKAIEVAVKSVEVGLEKPAIIIVGDGCTNLPQEIEFILKKNRDVNIVVNNHEIKDVMRQHLKKIEAPVLTMSNNLKFDKPKSKHHK